MKEIIEKFIISIAPSLVVAVFSIVQNGASILYQNSNLKVKYSSRAWRHKIKKGSFDTYVDYLIKCMFGFVIIFIIALFLCFFVLLFIPQINKGYFIIWSGNFIYLILFLFGGLLYFPNQKLINYKKNEINKMVSALIWDIPLADSFFLYASFCFGDNFTQKIFISLLIILVMEIGCCIYLDNESISQFKSIKIILDDNKTILNIKSDSLNVNDKWFVGIQCSGKEEKEIRVPQDKVKLIEYYNKQF